MNKMKIEIEIEEKGFRNHFASTQLGLAQFRLSVSPCLNRFPDDIIRIGIDADFVTGERDKVDLA